MKKLTITHYGTPRHSGRYPWGSGMNPAQRGASFIANVEKLRKQGVSEVTIANGMGMNSNELRKRLTIAGMEVRKDKESTAGRLKAKGYSNVGIGKRMGLNESSVRDLLNPVKQEKNKELQNLADSLKTAVAKEKFLDVGVGVERHMPGISRTKLQTALLMLQDEGYNIHYLKTPQVGTKHDTSLMVLAAPGDRKSQYREIALDKDKIGTLAVRLADDGETIKPKVPPRNISENRIQVRYAEDGGTLKDGTIEIRPSAEDLQIGHSRYAQVRIAVNGSHYIKGMAFYGDPKDFPPGVDIIFNTNKKKGTPVCGEDSKNTVLKLMKKGDPLNPFGASFTQDDYTDSTGKKQLSAINIVRKEGEWADWSNKLSSQVLSKQPKVVAERQLALAYSIKEEEFHDINSITNPSVKKLLMSAFADDCDASAVHLEATAFPHQTWNAILPFNSISETEVYAPNYNDGEHVALIRYPHGGRFEIPELVVNNSSPAARKAIGMARDAIGINSKVAERLSGADFDGDTVIVIPNGTGTIKSQPPLKGLKGFEPKVQYKGFDGMHVMTSRETGLEMGMISNLITDMTLKGAPSDEICRAVKHSMVVIDAEKHKLNYKQSFKDNRIAELKQRYQGRSDAGAATLISKASSQQNVYARKELVNKKKMTPEELEAYNSGKKVYRFTGEAYTKFYTTKKDPATGKPIIDPATGKPKRFPLKTPKVIKKQIESTKMYEATDARTLSSGQLMEEVYAAHANKLKALGNLARKAERNTPNLLYNPSAKITYAPEIDSLMGKLHLALMNPPLERQAQLIANKRIATIKEDNPGMSAGDLKKLTGRCLTDARDRVGAKKKIIKIEEREWEAIQAGAITHNNLMKILRNADLDVVKQMAMPRTPKGISEAKISKANVYLDKGYTPAQVATMLGISTSVLNKALGKKDKE